MKCNVSYKYLFIAIGILCPLFSACDYADGEGSGSENAWKHPIIKASSTSL